MPTSPSLYGDDSDLYSGGGGIEAAARRSAERGADRLSLYGDDSDLSFSSTPEPSESLISRAARGAWKVAKEPIRIASQAVGVPFQVAGAAATALQEYAAGVPAERSRIRLSPESLLGFEAPSIEQVGIEETIKRPAAEAGRALSQGTPARGLPLGFGLPAAAAARALGRPDLAEWLLPEDRNAPAGIPGMEPEYREAPPRLARQAEAVAEPVAELAAAWPAFGGAFEALGQVSRPAARVAGLAFAPEMVAGGVQGIAQAAELAKERGLLDPETIRAGIGGGTSLALGGLGLYHGLSPDAARARAEQARAAEAAFAEAETTKAAEDAAFAANERAFLTPDREAAINAEMVRLERERQQGISIPRAVRMATGPAGPPRLAPTEGLPIITGRPGADMVNLSPEAELAAGGRTPPEVARGIEAAAARAALQREAARQGVAIPPEAPSGAAAPEVATGPWVGPEAGYPRGAPVPIPPLPDGVEYGQGPDYAAMLRALREQQPEGPGMRVGGAPSEEELFGPAAPTIAEAAARFPVPEVAAPAPPRAALPISGAPAATRVAAPGADLRTQAAEFIRSDPANATTSHLQRRFRIGFSKAQGLLEDLRTTGEAGTRAPDISRQSISEVAPRQAVRIPPEGTGRETVSAPSPATFKEFVEAQGEKWPVKATEPRYGPLLEAFRATNTSGAIRAEGNAPELLVGEKATQPEPAPTPAQMEAGNYKKGHLLWNGLDISIETAKGGERVAKDRSWRVPDYPADYGYIKRTEGKDGDQVDVFMGDHPGSNRVFVIDQVNPDTGKFDEHKAMLGFQSQEAALDTYRRAYTDGRANERIGAVTEMPVDEFKTWAREGDTKRPLAPVALRERRAHPEAQPRERRQDLGERKRVEQMAPEEMRTALLTDDLTGLGNRRAWEEAPHHPAVAKLDAEGLKWINDNLGSKNGDDLLRGIGTAVKEEGLTGYRLGGDEFVFGAEAPEAADAAIARINKRLEGFTFTATLPDGTVRQYRGAQVHHGTGETYEAADAALNAAKRTAVEAGARAARGARPAGLVEVPTPRHAAERQPAPAAPTEVDLEDVRLSKRLEETLALPADQAALLVQAGKRVELERFSTPAEALQKSVLKLAMPTDVKVGSIGSINFLKNVLDRHPEIIGRKPVTPQVPNEPEAKYVLPTFATRGAAKAPETGPVEEPAKTPETGPGAPPPRGKPITLTPDAKAALEWAKSESGVAQFGAGDLVTRLESMAEAAEAAEGDGIGYSKWPAKAIWRAAEYVRQQEARATAPLPKPPAAPPEKPVPVEPTPGMRAAASQLEGELSGAKPKAPAPKEITVSFKAKPSVEIRGQLKAAGFRWDKGRGLWSAKPSSKASRAAFQAQTIGGQVRGETRLPEVPEPGSGRMPEDWKIEEPFTGETIKGGERKPVDMEARKAEIEGEVAGANLRPEHGREPEGRAGRSPEPADRTAREDQEPLEGALPEEVPSAGGRGRPGAEGEAGGRGDEGRLSPKPGSGPSVRPGVGAGKGELAERPVAESQPKEAETLVSDLAAKSGESPERAAAVATDIVSKKTRGHDHVIKVERLGAGGAKTKAEANFAAIDILKTLEVEDRPATPDEQAKLAEFVGWGAFPQLFKVGDREYYQPTWQAMRERLEKVLSPEELEAARRSTQNAHFTSVPIAKAMWSAARRAGVRPHARILEPGMGIGNFFGLQPTDMLPAKRTGVELDTLSGKIAKALYPRASVFIKPFEKTTLPKDFYDLVISNVPFARVRMSDPEFSRTPEVLRSLHDYYFGKSLALTRPGGLNALITSRYTMDRKNSQMREYLAKRAQFLGAVRLPNTAFKGNAGTEVVTDIVFLRKLLPGEQASGESWLNSVPIESVDKHGEKATAFINEYFNRHPEMVLGKHAMTGSMYGGAPEYTVEGEVVPENLSRALEAIPADSMRHWSPEEARPRLQVAPASEETKPNAYAVHDGNLVIRRGEFYEPADVKPGDVDRVKGMIGLRDATRRLLDLQIRDATGAEIQKAQATLGKAYDAFTKKHGWLTDRANVKAFEEDPDSPLLEALEEAAAKGKTPKKAAIFTTRTIQGYQRAEKADRADEALSIALRETGRVDVKRMEELTGKTSQELQEELGSLVYENPEGGSWETADAYLSGNVRKKLKVAESLAEGEPRYSRNVEALRAVIPKDWTPAEVRARIAAPWIPPSDIANFISELLDIPLEGYNYRRGGRTENVRVTHVPELGAWEVTLSDRNLANTTIGTERWGTEHLNAVDLIEQALNMREPTIKVKVSDDPPQYTVDKEATLAAREKQAAIQEEFQKWIWADEARAARLLRTYNDTFNAVRNREHDGAHLTFPGMQRGILNGNDLGKHQKDFAWQVIQATPRTNSINADDVGSGKTFALIAGAMERKRLGLSRKASVAAPKHVVGQWVEQWRKLYPSSALMRVEEKHVTPTNRQRLMSRVATGNYDGVIMAWEALEKLPVRRETYSRFINEQIAELEAAILGAEAEQPQASGRGGKKQKSRTVKQLEAAKDRLRQRLDEYLSAHTKDEAVTFEDLGIDHLMIDEAHGFKNLATPSKLSLAGIAQGGSKRAMDLYMKIRYINEHGGVVTFATATPVANTMGEAFVMQKFLQPDLLKEMGMEHFDSWAANFGEVVGRVEMTASGEFKRKNRFANFVNVSDLSTMLAETMKKRTVLDLPTPKVEGGKAMIHSSPSTPELQGYIEHLAERAERLRSGSVDPRVDNFLKLTTDGRKASTDIRLVRPDLADNAHSKMNQAADEIAKIHKDTASRKATQLVFLDMGTPKERDLRAQEKVIQEEKTSGEDAIEQETIEEAGHNLRLYEDLKQKLLDRGIPASQIAFIHDAKTEKQRVQLREAFNAGDKRILIGSTAKMGTGMNVQKRLFAEHLITPPWRPDQVKQAEGRIVRQGNMHYDLDIPVQIHRYVTEGSYDGVLWGILENKERFISQFMNAEPGVRIVEDVGDTLVGYAQAKAIASGNPLILEKVNVDSDMARLESLKQHHERKAYEAKFKIAGTRSDIARQEQILAVTEENTSKYLAAKAKAGDDFRMTVGDQEYTERVDAGKALLEQSKGQARKIGEFLGFDLELGVREIGTHRERVPIIEVGGRYANFNVDSPGGTISSIESSLRGLSNDVRIVKDLLGKARKNLSIMEADFGKPFDHEEKLARLRTRQKAINEELGIDKQAREEQLQTTDGGGEEGAPSDAGQEALGRLKRGPGAAARSIGSAAGAGAETFRDASIYGGSLIRDGVREFGDWSRRMMGDLGDSIKDLGHHLRSLYPKAREAAAAPAEGAPLEATVTPPERPVQRPVEQRLAEEAVTASNRAKRIADTFEATNEKFRIATEGAGRVEERGTIEKGEREAFRRAGQPLREETRTFRQSEADIEQSGAELVAAVKEFQKAERSFQEAADPESAYSMRMSRQIMEQAVKNWQVYRSGAGRQVQRFSQAIPQEIIQRLQEAGMIAGNLRNVRARAPIASNILNGLKNWGTLTDAEKRQVGKDVIDHFRLNLFSVTSWTLDAVGNAAELAAQGTAGVGRDLVLVAKGQPYFPSMQGLFRAIRAKAGIAHLAPEIEHELGTTVGGERLRSAPGVGIFTYKKGFGSKLYDATVGIPLYAKGAMDTAAKRLGFQWTMYREAIEAAHRQGIQGADQQAFIEGFLQDPPRQSLDRALSNGKKAGFNRDLSRMEERVASSTTARMLVDVFARWPFQFSRWAGEMLGWNPEMFKRFRSGDLQAEDIGEYLGKVAMGLGGLYLLNNLYDRTDFNSMEYVNEDGDRVRLSNRDPIPTGLWLLAVIKAAAHYGAKDNPDLEKAVAALRHASVPGARLLAGEGGLLGGTIKTFMQAMENPQNDPRALRRELEDTVNRAIPGQALLSAIKTAFDPTIREGIGAKVPGVSALLEPAINPATGTALEPRQRVLGVEIPSIGGVPIPGATRLIEPVQKLLARYGLMVYRGPRSPIAGYPPGQVPEDLRREWQELFGGFRNRLLSPLARAMSTLEDQDPERVRTAIQKRDRAAAEMANREMRRRHGGPRKLPRQETRRELAGPNYERRL